MPVLLGGPAEEPGGRQLLDLGSFLSDISDTLFTMTQPSSTPLQLPPEDGESCTQERRPVRIRQRRESGPGQGHYSTFVLLLTSPLPPPAYVGNADMIQPELTPLQPSLDDFMEISGGTGPTPGVEGQGQCEESPMLTSGQLRALWKSGWSG